MATSAAKEDVSVVFVGQKGAGKSTLIANLFGTEVRGSTGDHSIQTITRNGITFKIIDTVALGSDESHNKEHLEKLYAQTGQIDILIYCLPVNQAVQHNDINLPIMKSL